MSQVSLSLQSKALLIYGKYSQVGKNIRWENCWIQIRGIWIAISRQPGPPFAYFFCLDLKSLEDAKNQTGLTNSVLIRTSPMTGDITLYLSTTNRTDCISLLNMLEDGSNQLLAQIKSMEFTDLASGTAKDTKWLISKEITVSIDRDKLEISEAGKVKTDIAIQKLLSVCAKQNESNCGYTCVFQFSKDVSPDYTEVAGMPIRDTQAIITTFLSNCICCGRFKDFHG